MIKSAPAILILTMLALTACTKTPQPSKTQTAKTQGAPKAIETLVELPRDGLAEVARYSIEKTHYGMPVKGEVTMVIVRENIHDTTYVKTNKPDHALPAVKIMLMKTIASMNWDHRDNLALYSDANLQPRRLSITSEEWCGNNFLEWTAHNDKVSLIGRPYTDDVAPITETRDLATGYYLYEQLPVLIRAAQQHNDTIKLRLIGPQTAYLNPHTEEVNVTLVKKGTETVTTALGSQQALRVDVVPNPPTPHFPSSETYWLNPKDGTILRAERHEVSTEGGKLHVGRGTYILQDIQRIPYWDTPARPRTASLPHRQRATWSSEMGINLKKVFAGRYGNGFDLETYLKTQSANAPPEYLSDPKGNNTIKTTRDDKGGWFYDTKATLDGKPGRFRLNLPEKATK